MIKDFPSDGTKIKITSLEFNNFSCVKHGFIQIEKLPQEKSQILGLYGQNGSGKTTLINVLSLLKLLLCGNGINDVEKYITVGEKEASITAEFEINIGERKKLFTYNTHIVIEYDKWFIKSEMVSISDFDNSKNKSSFIYNSEDSINIITPQTTKAMLSSVIEENINISEGLTSQLYFLMQKEYSRFNKNSYIFNERFFPIYDSYASRNEESIFDYILLIEKFSMNYFFVINDSFISRELLSNENIPVVFQNQSAFSSGGLNYFSINLNGLTKVREEMEGSFQLFISQLNKAVSAFCPNTTLMAKKISYSAEVNKVFSLYEISTHKNGYDVPLKFESLGIKKIISIVNIMIFTYGNPSVLFVIDELDTSINEYILETYLTILKKEGSGQLIFTSNNLHPLELLDKEQCYFTTNNSDNCYTHLKYVKPNNNLRTLYKTLIKQGGDDKNSNLFVPISETNMKKIFDSFFSKND